MTKPLHLHILFQNSMGPCLWYQPDEFSFISELRAEVEIIEQMSSSSGSSSSDSESSSGSEDESSSSEGEEPAHVSPSQPPHQQYNNRNAVANGTSRPQGSNQLMNTLRK